MESRTPDYSGAFEKSLPADVLSMVAAISPGTLAHMRGVCRQWRCSISGNVQRAALQGGTEKSRRGKSGLPVAPPMPNIYHGIRVLNISCVEIDSQSLHALAGCAALSSLALQSCFLLDDALSQLPVFESLSHLSLSCSSFSTPATLRHVCCCGTRWRASEGRDRSCASDPGLHCTTSHLEDSLHDEFLVARSMSECHPSSIHDGDRATTSHIPETSSIMQQLPMNSGSTEDRSQPSASGVQCYRSLLSLDVSGITCLNDADLEELLCTHPKLVALAVSTGAAANTGIRAAASLCDLRHLDISFLGFSSPDCGQAFSSEATKATALSETLTAVCRAAAQRSAARLEASQGASRDASEDPLATLCNEAPWWRPSDPTAATGASAAGIPHATIEPSATFHLSIDLQLLVAFDRAWLRDSFATIPNRALTIRHRASSTSTPGASTVHSLVAAVSPEPCRILHVLLPEIIMGPVRLSHLELCGIETTESLLRHLLRIEEPPLSSLRLQNFDPDGSAATAALVDSTASNSAVCSSQQPDHSTAVVVPSPDNDCDNSAINEQLQSCTLYDECRQKEQRTAAKKARLHGCPSETSCDMDCSTSPFAAEETQAPIAPIEGVMSSTVASHPLQNMQAYTAARGVHSSRSVMKPGIVAPVVHSSDASTSRGKRRSSDGEPQRQCRLADMIEASDSAEDDAKSGRVANPPPPGQGLQRRSALQSALLAARWRRPSSAILRQIIDAHGEGLRCLHLTDLAGVNDTVMRRLRSHAPHLSSLTLSCNCPVTVEGIKELRFMRLRSLHLCHLSDPRIGQQAMPCVQFCTLAVRFNGIERIMQALELLSTPKNGLAASLQQLHFEGFALRASQLECITLMTKLRRLSLNHSSLSQDPPSQVPCCGMCDSSSCEHAASGRACGGQKEAAAAAAPSVSNERYRSNSCAVSVQSSSGKCAPRAAAPSCSLDAATQSVEYVPECENTEAHLDYAIEKVLAMPSLQNVSVRNSSLSEAFDNAATRVPGQCRVELIM